ncbi:hypothetical protein, partial [Pseudomonas aeruginosa]|uniref:hypothetical protein n=1 Tax=Pseudomonas aeruginosa TaxID=287 RepID=UPI001BAB279D
CPRCAATACIACNQACIGHFHRGYPISCIQHPETGRELTYATPNPASQSTTACPRCAATACIACNQACIGHFHRGYPISCIQHPETGRELTYAT